MHLRAVRGLEISKFSMCDSKLAMQFLVPTQPFNTIDPKAIAIYMSCKPNNDDVM